MASKDIDIVADVLKTIVNNGTPEKTDVRKAIERYNEIVDKQKTTRDTDFKVSIFFDYPV